MRAENSSSSLPDCRAYELVTNPFKEGFLATPLTYTDAGSFTYLSVGNFVDNGLGGVANQYLATRSGSGWQTVAQSPSGPAYTAPTGGQAAITSADLKTTIWVMRRPDESTFVQDPYLRTADGVFTRIGPGRNPATIPAGSPGSGSSEAGPVPAGASADLSHFVFTLDASRNQAYLGDTSIGATSLYEYVGTGNERPRLVGVDNTGHLVSECRTTAGGTGQASTVWSVHHAVSADGRVIFFTAAAGQPGGSTPCSGPAATEVWARVNGTTSFRVSASQCTRTAGDPGGACNAPANAVFDSASADGSRVFFTTTQQLVNGDTDQTSDLYACDIPPGSPAPTGTANACSSLTEVSGAATSANVEGVTRSSSDGSRVYFAATGVLASNAGANGAVAVSGDNNLYVWQKNAAHPTGQTTFVGKLAAGDTALWGPDIAGRMAQTTDDGRYLVLSTFSPLVASGPDADTDTAQDVYRYDADSGALVRLSTSTAGGGGNGSGLGATISTTQYSLSRPADRERTSMTADGSAAVFVTAEALSPDDTNGIADAYEWRDGHVSLISTGKTPVNGAVLTLAVYITSSGDDVYFTTTDRLSPGDGDAVQDVYDAKVGGGFHFPSKPVCDPDAACQPGVTPAPVVVDPGSTAPGPGDSVPDVAPSFSLRAVTTAELKKLSSTGKVALSVTANTPAALSAKATATVSGKPVSVASAQQSLAAPGTASLALMLSKGARSQLSKDGKLSVKVVVSDSRVAVTQSATLKLTHAKPKAKAKPKKKAKAPVCKTKKQKRSAACKKAAKKRAAVSGKGGRS